MSIPSHPTSDVANDPLVPPANSTVDAWLDRTMGVLRRSGRSLLVILALTVGVPSILLAVVSAAAGMAYFSVRSADDSVVTTFGVLAFIGAVLLSSIANAVGWGAGIWAVTAAAAGEPAPLGLALRAGLRRALPMWAWFLGYGLVVGIGLIVCVLPGLYFAVTLSLFSFVLMFERGTIPFGRSMKLVQASFRRALGRIGVLLVLAVGVNLVGGSIAGLVGEAVSRGGATSAGEVLGGAVTAVLQVLTGAVLLAGLLVTYAEARGAREPLSTNDLWTAVR
ncbi:MAG TPA: hypothetical protein VFB74_02020 [Kribbellaceae bacterium]|nr:hypothetical protein [Kribbellaceae bacterium]